MRNYIGIRVTSAFFEDEQWSNGQELPSTNHHPSVSFTAPEIYPQNVIWTSGRFGSKLILLQFWKRKAGCLAQPLLNPIFKDAWIFEGEKQAHTGGPSQPSRHSGHLFMRRLSTVPHPVKVTYYIRCEANGNAHFILCPQHSIQLRFLQPL